MEKDVSVAWMQHQLPVYRFASEFVFAMTITEPMCSGAATNGRVPVSIHEFGTGAPWPKKKVGAMRYLDCELVGTYAPRKLRLVAAN